MEKEIKLRKWIENFNKGEYEKGDFDTQVKAGWYDWFCRDTSLVNKTRKLGNILKQITNPLLLDNYYISLKNCCPASNHPLYDRISFITLDEKHDVTFVIEIGDKRTNYNYCIFYEGTGFEDPLKGFRTSRELINFLNDLTLSFLNNSEKEYKENFEKEYSEKLDETFEGLKDALKDVINILKEGE